VNGWDGAAGEIMTALAEHGPMKHSDLIRMLAPRGITGAGLTRIMAGLVTKGHVRQSTAFHSRQPLYSLAGAPIPPDPATLSGVTRDALAAYKVLIDLERQAGKARADLAEAAALIPRAELEAYQDACEALDTEARAAR